MKTPVQLVEITAQQEQQRLDNFLATHLKGVPKSAIYRLIRRGEVRINQKRALPEQKLSIGDLVRIPPLELATPSESKIPPKFLTQLLKTLLYEDEHLLVINKPAGLAVHAGSGIDFGVIDILQTQPDYQHLQLVHRLDRETSGCLVLAKNRPTLTYLNELMRSHQIEKRYLALVQGRWPAELTQVSAPLQKFQYGKEFKVELHPEGKQASTHFSLLKTFSETSLIEAELETGRMHQIRVHCQLSRHPIAGDEKYGDPAFNKKLHAQGIKRLFLHAKLLKFQVPHLEKPLAIEAPLADDLQIWLEQQ